MADTKTVVPTPEILLLDFELKCSIGHGAFGEVFLALSKATRRYRAVKLVRRSRFDSDRPYEIEFAGVKRFEEVSREHEGFVDILHVSRDDHAGHFSYVMEVADDLESAQQIDPEHYVPRTLSKELAQRGRLPPAECVRVALALIAALAELHRRNLVHRDIKPANIVFVRGAPKLADVGLVTEPEAEPHTVMGTPDYMDQEVHGTPAGDLYSFGRVLYTMGTGLPPSRWPKLPEDFNSIPDLPVFMELDAIWRKACQDNRTARYQDALKIHRELLALQAGASVLRLKRFERAVAFFRRYGLMLLALGLTLGAGGFFHAREQAQKEELRQRKVGSSVAYGNRALDSGDLLGALSWFAEAWRLDAPRSKDDFNHRMRVESVLRHAPTLVQMWFQDRDIKEAYFTGAENQVLMSDRSGQWRVYDLASGQPLHQPFGVGLPDELVSFSSRTATAVTSAGTNGIYLWNYQTGTRLLQLERPAQLTYAALSPDGARIAAAEAMTNVLLWKTTNAAPIVLGRHPMGILSLVFSPDSRLLISGGEDGRAQIWDVESGRLVCIFTNHAPGKWVYHGTFSPDSRHALTTSFDRSARIWGTHSAEELLRFRHDDAVFAAEYNSDGTRVVTAGLDFTARIWDLKTQESLQVLPHNSKVINATFSPREKFLLTSCFDNTVRVWRLRQLPPVAPADGLLALSGFRSILRTNGVWSLCATLGAAPGAIIGSLEITNELGVGFSFASDDRYFVIRSPAEPAADSSGRAQCFDARTALPLGQSIATPQNWTNVAVSAGGRWIFASNGETGAVWNVTSGERIASLSDGYRKGAFSPDGQLLAMSRANQVDVFSLENGFTKLATRSHPEDSTVSAIEWEATGHRLITSCMNGLFTPLEAQVWTARTGAAACPPLLHRDGVIHATFSHSGTHVITCGEDFIAILWDPVTGRRQAPPLVHRDQVVHAAFSVNDRLVATATSSRMITVWSAETGDRLTLPIALSPLPAGQVRSIQFIADDRALIIRDNLDQSYLVELPHYQHPLADLLLTAQLLSAQQTDSTERQMPHSKEALQNIWQTLRAKYPEDFSLSGN